MYSICTNHKFDGISQHKKMKKINHKVNGQNVLQQNYFNLHVLYRHNFREFQYFRAPQFAQTFSPFFSDLQNGIFTIFQCTETHQIMNSPYFECICLHRGSTKFAISCHFRYHLKLQICTKTRCTVRVHSAAERVQRQ